MKRIIFLIFSFTLYLQVQGEQSDLPYWERKVQFFTPNAETIGRFGQVPVNYFNGLPQVSIPLTTFSVNGYSLPVTLSYYAGGNKPDSHPGWVGQGWSLSAGGSITRMINGSKDETSENESEFMGAYNQMNPGYYFRTDSINRTNWSDSTYLKYVYIQTGFNAYHYDTEPDEFQIHVDDINASFYIIGTNSVKIKSKENLNFKVEFSTVTENTISENLYPFVYNYLYIRRFTYINKIIVTKTNGVKYVFGNNLNSIEFSYKYLGSYFVATPNTWHLNQVILSNGETVTFNYSKDGIPIVENKNHSTNTSYQISNQSIYGFFDSRQVTGQDQYKQYSYTFLQPSYLTSIVSSSGNVMNFKRSKTTELTYNRSQAAFDYRMFRQSNNSAFTNKGTDYSLFQTNDYYMKLDSISTNNGRIQFMYSNQSTGRLKLLTLAFLDKQNTTINNYAFSYDPQALPDYNSKMTDNWGYYNGKNYDAEDYENLYSFRSPDTTYMKAEILRKIIYPTGGYSQFKYEQHDFGKVAHQFPFDVKDSTGIAGGLRIKRIITTNTDSTTNTREFYYTSKTGQSSGILSGIPLYAVGGNQHVKYNISYWYNWMYYTASADYNYGYYMKSQNQLNQLGNTNGNHVTYSRVTEKLSNGSNTIYYYSNYDKFPDEYPATVLSNIDSKLPINGFVSKEIERGLLDSVEYYNTNTPVKKELYYYNSDPTRYNDFVKSINTYHLYDMIRLSALKIYTFCPYLQSKKEVTYNNSQQIITETKYKYDGRFRILTNQIIKDSHGDSLTTVFTYPFHIEYNYLADAPVQSNSLGSRVISTNLYATCRSMNSAYLLNSPVEITTFKNAKIINSKFIFYGKHGIDYLADSIYSLETTTPLSTFMRFGPPGFVPYIIDGHYEITPTSSFMYDSKSNITQITEKGGIITSYLWSYKSQYPVAEIKNATYAQVTSALLTLGTDPATIAASATPDMTKINGLRNSMTGAMVTTYTYKPFVGVLTATDPHGVITYYEYDYFNRLVRIKDVNMKTIKEYQYHYITEQVDTSQLQ
ncbi:MAG: hypothetical protein PHR83_12755 [Paludibacter sp.]|nr:hypothetical protein [Paludibacter sp.]